MDKAEIKERAEKIFRSVFLDDNIVLTDAMTSDDVNGWDSLTHLQLIMGLEKEFGIKFTTMQIKNTSNVGALLQIIESKTVK